MDSLYPLFGACIARHYARHLMPPQGQVLSQERPLPLRAPRACSFWVLENVPNNTYLHGYVDFEDRLATACVSIRSTTHLETRKPLCFLVITGTCECLCSVVASFVSKGVFHSAEKLPDFLAEVLGDLLPDVIILDQILELAGVLPV